ncbi:MAG: hypothetical protein LBH63_05280 [Clostridiales Family XIII bacterium]|jgi:hypothetical protein|nr:hypothetical protein [Clostridiales Family XIII bacterium]
MRNFLYSKSDIFVAIAIIAVAGLIIWSRVDAIMEFPGGDEATGTKITDSEETTPAQIEESETPSTDDSSSTQPPENTEGVTGENSEEQPPEQPTSAKFVVEIGQATSEIASNLSEEGLIKSTDEFLSAVNEMNAESKLKAGGFDIPTGASVTDIVNILTG